MNKQKINFDFFIKKKNPSEKTKVVKKKNSSSGVTFPKMNFSKISFFSYTKFSIKKQTFFAKRLSFLIKAGVPMLESIHVIRQQTKSKHEIKVFDKIIADVSNE